MAWFLFLSPDPWILGFGDLPRLGPTRAVTAASLVGAQIVVLALYLSRGQSMGRGAIRPPGLANGKLLAVLAVSILTATAVTARPSIYLPHAALTALLLSLSWATVAAAAVEAGGLGLDSRIQALLDADRTPWVMAVIATGVALVLNRVVLDGIPHIPDEVVYLLQAKYLSQGQLYVTGVPGAALDVISTMTYEGRWFGIFPVGWPAVLALGSMLGVPWLVNPLLTGLVILLAHGLVSRVWSLRAANLTAFLLCTSPWLLYLGASFMSHPLSIAAALLALRGAVEAGRGSGAKSWAPVGGTALGLLVLVRPFEGVLIGLVCSGVLIAYRKSLVPSPRAWAFGVVAIAVGGLTLPYNHALTGDALLDPITQYFDTQHYPGSNRLGFGPDIGNLGWGNDALSGHSPLEALLNVNWNASLVQLELFGWGFGSLAVVLLALARWRGVVDRRLASAFSVVALVATGYLLYWYSAADFGARYWSQMIVPLAAISAVALLELQDAARLRRIIVIASLIGAPVVLVMRGAIKYRDYRGMTRYMEALAERHDFGHDLILIRGGVFSDYSPGLILNPAAMDGPGPLYFRWVEQEDLSRLRERFPDRRVWIVEGPSVSGGQPRVVSGPTS